MQTASFYRRSRPCQIVCFNHCAFIYDNDKLVQQLVLQESIRSLDLSPDHSFLCLTTGRSVHKYRWTEDALVCVNLSQIWPPIDLSQIWEEISTFGSKEFKNLCCSYFITERTGKFLLTLDQDGFTVWKVDTDSFKVMEPVFHQILAERPMCHAKSPDNMYLALFFESSGMVKVWSLKDLLSIGMNAFQYLKHWKSVQKLYFVPSELHAHVLVTIDADYQTRYWRPRPMLPAKGNAHSIHVHTSWECVLHISPTQGKSLINSHSEFVYLPLSQRSEIFADSNHETSPGESPGNESHFSVYKPEERDWCLNYFPYVESKNYLVNLYGEKEIVVWAHQDWSSSGYWIPKIEPHLFFRFCCPITNIKNLVLPSSWCYPSKLSEPSLLPLPCSLISTKEGDDCVRLERSEFAADSILSTVKLGNFEELNRKHVQAFSKSVFEIRSFDDCIYLLRENMVLKARAENWTIGFPQKWLDIAELSPENLKDCFILKDGSVLMIRSNYMEHYKNSFRKVIDFPKVESEHAHLVAKHLSRDHKALVILRSIDSKILQTLCFDLEHDCLLRNRSEIAVAEIAENIHWRESLVMIAENASPNTSSRVEIPGVDFENLVILVAYQNSLTVVRWCGLGSNDSGADLPEVDSSHLQHSSRVVHAATDLLGSFKPESNAFSFYEAEVRPKEATNTFSFFEAETSGHPKPPTSFSFFEPETSTQTEVSNPQELTNGVSFFGPLKKPVVVSKAATFSFFDEESAPLSEESVSPAVPVPLNSGGTAVPMKTIWAWKVTNHIDIPYIEPRNVRFIRIQKNLVCIVVHDSAVRSDKIVVIEVRAQFSHCTEISTGGRVVNDVQFHSYSPAISVTTDKQVLIFMRPLDENRHQLLASFDFDFDVKRICWVSDRLLSYSHGLLQYCSISANESPSSQNSFYFWPTLQYLIDNRLNLVGYHPRVLLNYLLWGKFGRVKAVLRHLHDFLKVTENATDCAEIVPPIPIQKLFSIDAPHKNASSEDLFSLDKQTTDATDPLFCLDDGVLSAENVSYLSEQICHRRLDGIDGPASLELLALMDALIQVEEQKQALDEYALQFVLTLRFFVFMQRSGRATKISNSMNFRDFITAFFSESQDLLMQTCHNLYSGMRWSEAKTLGMSFWVKNVEHLRQQCEIWARNQYLHNDEKDPVKCALLYLILGKKKVWLGLWKLANAHPEQGAMLKFLQNDFEEERWQKAAAKNAFVLMGKQRFEYAAAFFVLAKQAKDAISVCIKQLQDFQLALLIARIWDNDDGPILSGLYNEFLCNSIATENRWGAVWVLDRIKRKNDALKATILPLDELDFPNTVSAKKDAGKSLHETQIFDPFQLFLFRSLSKALHLQQRKSLDELVRHRLIPSYELAEQSLLQMAIKTYLYGGHTIFVLDLLAELRSDQDIKKYSTKLVHHIAFMVNRSLFCIAYDPARFQSHRLFFTYEEESKFGFEYVCKALNIELADLWQHAKQLASSYDDCCSLFKLNEVFPPCYNDFNVILNRIIFNFFKLIRKHGRVPENMRHQFRALCRCLQKMSQNRDSLLSEGMLEPLFVWLFCTFHYGRSSLITTSDLVTDFPTLLEVFATRRPTNLHVVYRTLFECVSHDAAVMNTLSSNEAFIDIVEIEHHSNEAFMVESLLNLATQEWFLQYLIKVLKLIPREQRGISKDVIQFHVENLVFQEHQWNDEYNKKKPKPYKGNLVSLLPTVEHRVLWKKLESVSTADDLSEFRWRVDMLNGVEKPTLIPETTLGSIEVNVKTEETQARRLPKFMSKLNTAARNTGGKLSPSVLDV